MEEGKKGKKEAGNECTRMLGSSLSTHAPSTISLPVPISMPSLNACEHKEIGNTFNTNLLRSCTDTDSVSIQTATPNHN